MPRLIYILFCITLPATLLLSCAKPGASTGSPASVSMPNTTNKTALRIYNTLPVYAAAAKKPWTPIVMRVPLKKGGADNRIPEIRERLVALQMLPTTDQSNSTVYDPLLVNAVTEFQLCNGLKPTGVINQDTLNALNVPPSERYYELAKAMYAWARYPQDANSRYIQVNIPSYQMTLIDRGEEKIEMKVIVGRPSRPTPTLSSSVTTIVFNPSWNVPETILEKDVIPGMRANPNYLKEHYDMHIYTSYDKNATEINPTSIDWQTATAKNFRYRVSAPPSAVNPLGRVKFIFANDHDVYMHDTPEKSLFSLTDRARSSGCIRLEDPMALVHYFYADNSDLNEPLVNQYLSTYQTKYIQLKNALPVYVTYITAWVDADGYAHFARDVYHNEDETVTGEKNLIA